VKYITLEKLDAINFIDIALKSKLWTINTSE